jgi:very-short-patch-repair endonuclease
MTSRSVRASHSRRLRHRVKAEFRPTVSTLARWVHRELLRRGCNNRLEEFVEISWSEVDIFSYHADIWIPEFQLDVEIDGCQHSVEPQLSKDIIRDRNLRACGFHVIRFRNGEVSTDLKKVVDSILEKCETIDTESF